VTLGGASGVGDFWSDDRWWDTPTEPTPSQQAVWALALIVGGSVALGALAGYAGLTAVVRLLERAVP
jgi:hypothetical protein